MAVTVIVSNPLSLQGVSDADQDVGKQLIGMRVGQCKTRHARERQSGNGCLQYTASSQYGHFVGSLKRFNQIDGLTRSGAAIVTRASAGTVTAGAGSATLVAGPPSAVARTTGTTARRIAGAAGTVAAGRGIAVWTRCRTRLRTRSGRLVARQPEISILGRRVTAASSGRPNDRDRSVHGCSRASWRLRHRSEYRQEDCRRWQAQCPERHRLPKRPWRFE